MKGRSYLLKVGRVLRKWKTSMTLAFILVRKGFNKMSTKFARPVVGLLGPPKIKRRVKSEGLGKFRRILLQFFYSFFDDCRLMDFR